MYYFSSSFEFPNDEFHKYSDLRSNTNSKHFFALFTFEAARLHFKRRVGRWKRECYSYVNCKHGCYFGHNCHVLAWEITHFSDSKYHVVGFILRLQRGPGHKVYMKYVISHAKHDSYAPNSSSVCTSITLTFPTANATFEYTLSIITSLFSTQDHLKWKGFEVFFSWAMHREAEHPFSTHA